MDNFRAGGNNTEPVDTGVFPEAEKIANKTTEMGQAAIRQEELGGAPVRQVGLDETSAEQIRSAESQGELGERQTSADQRGLGESAVASERFFDAAPAPEVPGILPERQNSESQTELGKNDTELKTLATDGSTEKNKRRHFSILDGDTISKSFKAKIDKQIETHKNDPHGLDNVRNEEMTEYLRDEFGRIFADDGNEAVVIPMAGNLDENRGGSKAA